MADEDNNGSEARIEELIKLFGQLSGDSSDDSDQTASGTDGDDLIATGAGDDTISGGLGDDTLYGAEGNDEIHGGSGEDVIGGGEGDDLLYGGEGSDALFGGSGNDTLYGGSVGGGGSERVTITFEGSTAAYENSLGFYVVDPETGEISDVQMAFENASPEGDDPVSGGGDLIPGTSSYSFDVPKGAEIGAFLVSDGNSLNDYDALGSGQLAFLDGDGNPATLDDTAPKLYHIADDGTKTALDGDTYHSAGFGGNTKLNPDGEVHIKGFSDNGSDSWTFGFEDKKNLGDEDYDDTLFTVDMGDTGATFLNPDFDATGHVDDPDTTDLLVGGSGDDEIHTGEGAGYGFGGEGDDSIYAGGGDTVDGGENTDTLFVKNPDKIVDQDVKQNGSDDEGNPSFDGHFEYEDGSKLSFESIEKIVPCFTPGTSIATPEGEKAVESLRVGDKVITRDNGIQEIRWIGHRRMDWGALQANPHLKPILIRRGSLGNDLPERDMIVSPQHRMLVANDRTALYFEEHEVLVAAKHLRDHRGVCDFDSMGTTYVHFMCDRHEVVLSNGAWSETFQPGDYTLKGMGNAQRLELFEIFPELDDKAGREGYRAARKTLRRHEARLLALS